MSLSLPARLPPDALLRPGVLLLVGGLHAAALAWLLASKTPEVVVAPAAPVIEGVLLAPPAPRPPEPAPVPPAPAPVVQAVPPVTPRAAPAPVPAVPAATPDSLQAPPPLAVAAAALPSPASNAPPSDELPIVPPMESASPRDQPRSYPPLSVSRQEEGRVLLEVYIRADGTVGEVRLLQSSGHRRLDADAMQSVKRWRYVPARRGNQPIPYWYRQPVDYVLGR